jgi:hypothetical protein
MIGINGALVIILVMFWIGLGMTAEYVESSQQSE